VGREEHTHRTTGGRSETDSCIIRSTALRAFLLQHLLRSCISNRVVARGVGQTHGWCEADVI
jgi:hypothetical protein